MAKRIAAPPASDAAEPKHNPIAPPSRSANAMVSTGEAIVVFLTRQRAMASIGEAILDRAGPRRLTLCGPEPENGTPVEPFRCFDMDLAGSPETSRRPPPAKRP